MGDGSMKYDHETNPCRCPKCKGLGWPWMGYFSCEDCGAIFFIETGEEVRIKEWVKNPIRGIVEAVE